MNRSAHMNLAGNQGVPVSRVIEGVAWSVPPNAARHTRPVQLVNQLSRMGLISEKTVFVHAGRAPSAGTHQIRARAPWYPTVPRSDGAWAVLSPVFRGVRDAVWRDYYDDWSIAPDINPLHRAIASATYRTMSRVGQEASTTITVNTSYMARKLGLADSHIIPNGVDPSLADVPIAGDSLQRLVVLGTFMDGRTDWDMLRNFVLSGRWREVLIGAPGTSAAMLDILKQAERRTDVSLRVVDWLPVSDLGHVAGSRTVCLIPHLVNDYTLSQDLMKAYQFAALGLPTIVPTALIPPGLGAAPLVGFVPDQTVTDLKIPPLLAVPDRVAFCRTNSWAVRAQGVADLMAANIGL